MDSRSIIIKEGFNAAKLNITREHNWYEKVRPGTKDSELWFFGYDLHDRCDEDNEWNF